MFYCQVSGVLSQPCEKPTKLVVERRERTYTARVKNEETREWETVEIGKGWEICKELTVSDAGLRKWNGMNEEQRENFLLKLKSK